MQSVFFYFETTDCDFFFRMFLSLLISFVNFIQAYIICMHTNSNKFQIARKRLHAISISLIIA
jgi:hypothetical protein